MKHSARPLSICFYSPYVPKHFGGGERHFFTIATILSRFYHVVVAISKKEPLTEEEGELIRTAYSEKFGLDLSWLDFQSTPLGTEAGFLTKLLWTKQFDKLFSVSDGSIFFSLARQNVLHIQIPFTHSQSGLVSKLKLNNWEINTNSIFTKEVIERKWSTHVKSVLYPCVDIHEITPGKKGKIILHIGRFFRQLHTKRQDVLVDAFIKLIKKYPQQMAGWKLIMIGEDEDKKYATEVAEKAKGFPIKIIHDAPYEEVLSYLKKATLYWHATGFDVDDFVNPELAEHFGITTVEAMAAGCVPIVTNKGGQKEIVEHGVSGFLWNEIDGLIEKTLAIVSDTVETKDLAQNARERAEFFDQSHFIPDVFSLFQLDPPKITEIQAQKVSAIIPTYNGQAVLEKHLPSVERCLRDGDEIVIVDDASTDNTFNWLKKQYGLKEETDRASFDDDLWRGKYSINQKNILITVIVNKKNLRFASSVNKGVGFAKHDLIFLLNNDVSPAKNVLDHLLPYFTPHPERVKNRGRVLPSPEEVFGVSPAEIDNGKIVAGKNELWFERGMFVHSKAKRMTSGPTAWLSGGSALINKQKWNEIGGLDSDYFPAYWEDIDLSAKARQKGWFILFDAQAQVFHHHETTNESAFGKKNIEVISIKNSFVFLRKNSSFWQKIQFLFWLPYHLTVTNYRSNGIFFLGLVKYLQSRWISS